MRSLDKIITNRGSDLATMSHQSSVLLVFLRHFDCVFCRQALKDISAKSAEFVTNKVQLVFVHMSTYDQAKAYFDEYNITNYQHISDPSCKLYKEFGLKKGTFSQLFGLQIWSKGFKASTTENIPFRLNTVGDSFQMPGIFILCEGKIEDSYIHKNAADRPNYQVLINCCSL